MLDHLESYNFDLPEALIAQNPIAKRSDSRLLHVAADHLQHLKFQELTQQVMPGDLLIFNDTKVLPARILGHKVSGGKIECLINRILDQKLALAYVRSNKSLADYTKLVFPEATASIISRENDLFLIEFDINGSLIQYLEQYGKVPLPPYIEREPTKEDIERYQTVYAEKLGAVAAPTAGLHFDQQLLDQLIAKGVKIKKVTLHVGAGTFQPIRVMQLAEHKMHKEFIEVNEDVCRAIEATKIAGRQIIAVGTTVMRCLETAALSGKIQTYAGDTDIFIRPGFKFKVVDRLITNFHLPKSSLLILICAFGGYERVMKSYQEAITQGYRFYSYGDAMLLDRF